MRCWLTSVRVVKRIANIGQLCDLVLMIVTAQVVFVPTYTLLHIL